MMQMRVSLKMPAMFRFKIHSLKAVYECDGAQVETPLKL